MCHLIGLAGSDTRPIATSILYSTFPFMGCGDLTIIRPLIRPKRLWSWRELRSSPTYPPASPGVYAWWFREIPPGVPTWGTERHHRYRLLYVGISPSKPSASTGKQSKQNVRERLRYHFSGNASGSTLRMTLGSLLLKELKLKPVATDSGSIRFGTGEDRLDEWMARWARVCWIEYERPWELEDVAIRGLRLPLNIQGNNDEEFRAVLKRARARARASARE